MEPAVGALIVVAMLFLAAVIYAPIWWFTHRPKASSDAA